MSKPKRVKKAPVVPLSVRVDKKLFTEANKARIASGKTWVEIFDQVLTGMLPPKGLIERAKEKLGA